MAFNLLFENGVISYFYLPQLVFRFIHYLFLSVFVFYAFALVLHAAFRP